MMLASSTIPTTQCKNRFPCLWYIVSNATAIVPGRRRKPASSPSYHGNFYHSLFFFKPKSRSVRLVLASVSNGDGATDANPQQSSAVDIKEIKDSSSTFIALFVRMLGLDYDPLDREQAMVALWKYSLGGKKCDKVMQFSGCINLTISLLKLESTATCEAAAGLLRSVSSINVYRDCVAESGAIEEIIGLLSRPSLTSEL